VRWALRKWASWSSLAELRNLDQKFSNRTVTMISDMLVKID
jgi:hypothetical protein